MVVPQLPPKSRGFRRFWPLYLILAVLLIAYVSSYIYISRMRQREYMALKCPGIFYVSAARAQNDPEDTWVPEHVRLLYFYAPINAIDREFFGGPGTLHCVLRHIGPKRE